QLSRKRGGIVLEAFIVGFAANYLLPARLGELFRADYLKRISGLPRTAALGSIAVERTIDGLTVVALLVLSGLALKTSSASQVDERAIVIVGVMIFSGLAVLLLVARHTHTWLAAREGHLFRYALAFVHGVRSLNRLTALPILGLTAVIWAMELAMLLCV